MVGHFTGPNETVDNLTGLAAVNATTDVCSGAPSGCIGDSLFGYWNSSAPIYSNANDANTTSRYFSLFQPGGYTIVAEDMWGSTVYSYFQVEFPIVFSR
jgi:hypothetical protein